MLDVAAVVEKLIEKMGEETLLQSVIDCGIPNYENARAFLLYWVALHDFGKATPGFQAKVQSLADFLKERGFDFSTLAETNHSISGQQLLTDLLITKNVDEDVASGWARTISSHHGNLPSRYDEEHIVGTGVWEEARLQLVDELERLFDIKHYPNSLPDAATQIQIMGLCTLADWIGSSEEYFQYQSYASDIETYYSESLRRAQKALDILHISALPKNEKSFFDLFPHFDSLNPVQETALRIGEKLHNPFMMVIEAPMGLGKTEAALGVFAEVCSHMRSHGLYFALPTQATGNMVYARLEEFLKRFNVGQSELHLLHGTASLNPLYRQLKLHAIYTDEGALYASSWFGGGKRSLLAHYGAGTVDQILLGALRSRHFFLRLFALAGKTVIIDEVHAYDAYMSKLLEVLISWLRFLGSTVILLSATLPAEKRSSLLSAYDAGRVDSLTLASYPAVHGISADGALVSETIYSLDEETAWISPLIKEEESWEPVVTMLQIQLQEGGCAAVIINTVADAQRLFEELSRYFEEEELDLFHARFPLQKRLEIEKRIVQRYGKKGARPRRGIVVATQMIEQSLDLDFDLMISDLAPVDLLLQRMGRLHRHRRERPAGLQKKELHVLLPPRLSEDEKIFGKSRFLYFPILLYRTAKLFESDTENYQTVEITFPHGLTSLVESVYGGDEEEKIEKWNEEKLGEEYADIFLACQYSIPENLDNDGEELLDSLDNRLGDDPDDPRAKTRLGPPTVTLAITEPQDRQIENFSDVERIYMQTLKIQTRWLVEEMLKRETPETWREEPMLRHAVPFDPEEQVERGGWAAYYDERLGMVITPKKEKE
ncbi:CRISPR-associated helicase Cas3 [Hydrogenimonas sp.]|nr:CRISPR-associated helicase Cas3 [Hydrogenimonas sp.]